MQVFVLCIVVVSCAMEFYKKVLRGTSTEDGTKTKANKCEVITVAFILSLLAGLLFYKIESLSNIWTYFLIVPSIYFLQYLLDMKVIKSILNAVVKNTADKL